MKKTDNKTQITTILFDFGNVLMVDTEKIFEDFFELKKLPKYKADKYEAVSHFSERGIKSTKDLLKTIKQIFNLPYSLKQIEQLLSEGVLINPMWHLLKELSKTYKVAVLTNNQKSWPKKAAKYAHISLKGLKIFNSANIGVRKPLKFPYLYVLEHLKVKSEEMVFIDDKIKNIQTAKKLGIHGIHFTGDMQAVYSDLKKLGINVKIK